MVMNYIGPDNGQGIRIYVYGLSSLMHAAAVKFSDSHPPGDGGVILGDYSYGDTDPYSVTIDEMLFFNKTLNSTEVAALVNNV